MSVYALLIIFVGQDAIRQENYLPSLRRLAESEREGLNA
jgi:hypothetical protein